jgi:hypothetical protein
MHALEQQANQISSTIDLVESDLRVLSNDQDLLLYIQPDANEEIQRNQEVETYMASFVDAHNIYDQLRLLDVRGQELIRVERIDGYVRVIDKPALQYKGDRYYVKEMMGYGFGELYMSNIDLNREGKNAAIEIPYHPVVRVGLTLFNEIGKPQGYLLANLNVKELLSEVQPIIDNADVLIVAEDGTYIKHPDSTKLCR